MVSHVIVACGAAMPLVSTLIRLEPCHSSMFTVPRGQAPVQPIVSGSPGRYTDTAVGAVSVTDATLILTEPVTLSSPSEAMKLTVCSPMSSTDMGVHVNNPVPSPYSTKSAVSGPFVMATVNDPSPTYVGVTANSRESSKCTTWSGMASRLNDPGVGGPADQTNSSE